MAEQNQTTINPDDLALWRSLGRLARLLNDPCDPPSVLSYLNDAWAEGWRQEDAYLAVLRNVEAGDST